MKFATKLFLVYMVAGASVVEGLQCSSHDILKRYQIDKYTSVSNVERDTPPSKTKETWWINPCEENKDNIEIPSGCKDKDMLCGITEVKLPDKDPIITQIIDFSSSMAYSVEEVSNQVILALKSTKWGSQNVDARITFECNTNMKTDEIVSTYWEDQQIQLAVRGPSGCLKENNDKDDNNSDNDNDNNKNDESTKKNGGFSWFTWLFAYALLFTIIYLIIVSYMNTRGGSFDDFRGEFVERSTQFVISLPEFGKEVVLKIFGRSSLSQRGGYSAV